MIDYINRYVHSTETEHLEPARNVVEASLKKSEHRRFPRKPVKLQACEARLDNGKFVACQVLNLNKHGVLIELRERVFIQEVYVFNLTSAEARGIEVQGRVAWVKPKEGGGFQAGVAFRNLSADEEYWVELMLVRNEQVKR